MKCRHCSSEVDQNFKYCPECGGKLKTDSPISSGSSQAVNANEVQDETAISIVETEAIKEDVRECVESTHTQREIGSAQENTESHDSEKDGKKDSEFRQNSENNFEESQCMPLKETANDSNRSHLEKSPSELDSSNTTSSALEPKNNACNIAGKRKSEQFEKGEHSVVDNDCSSNKVSRTRDTEVNVDRKNGSNSEEKSKVESPVRAKENIESDVDNKDADTDNLQNRQNVDRQRATDNIKSDVGNKDEDTDKPQNRQNVDRQNASNSDDNMSTDTSADSGSTESDEDDTKAKQNPDKTVDSSGDFAVTYPPNETTEKENQENQHSMTNKEKRNQADSDKTDDKIEETDHSKNGQKRPEENSEVESSARAEENVDLDVRNKDEDTDNPQDRQKNSKDQSKDESSSTTPEKKRKMSIKEKKEQKQKKKNEKSKAQERKKMEEDQFGEKMKVVFHVLISKSFNIKPDEDKVYIRFGHDFLGGWSQNRETNKLKILQNREDVDFIEYDLEVMIPKNILSKGIQYKYVINYSSGEHVFEYVHFEEVKRNYSGRANRRIKSTNNSMTGEDWHQYDGFCYPPKEKKNFLQRIKKWVLSDTKIDINTDVLTAIEYFIHPLVAEVFQLTIDRKENIIQLEGIAKRIRMVLSNLRFQVLKPFTITIDEERFVQIIFNVLFSPILQHLDSVKERNEVNLLLAIFLVELTNSYEILLPLNTKNKICKHLVPQYDDKDKVLPILDVIKEISDMRFLINSLRKFIIKSCDREYEEDRDRMWMLALPLYHFLNSDSKPFTYPDKKEKHNTPEWWHEKEFKKKIDNLKSSFLPTQNCEEILKELAPLFQMDYLLPRLFIASLPRDDLLKLIETGYLPPDVCCAALFYHLSYNRTMSVYESLRQAFRKSMICIANLIKHSQISLHDRDGSELFGIVKDLFELIYVSFPSYFTIEGLLLVFAMFDHPDAISHIKVFCEMIEPCFDEYLKINQLLHPGYREFNEEFKHFLWKINKLLGLKEHVRPEFGERWEKMILNNLNYGVDIVPGKDCLIFYCSDYLDQLNSHIENSLTEKAFLAFDEEFKHQGSFSNFSERTEKFFLRSWDGFFRKFVKNHSTAFSWLPLVHFLKRFYGCDDGNKMIPVEDEVKEQIAVVYSVLTRYRERIETGDITKKELENILKKKETSLPLLSLTAESTPLDVIFQLRETEMKIYEEQMELAQLFLNICNHNRQFTEFKKYQEIRDRFDELTKNGSETNIREIYEIPKIPDYSTINYEIYSPPVNPLGIPREVQILLPQLNDLMRSTLFLKMWKKHYSRITDSLFKSIEILWEKTKKDLDDFKKKLEDGSITFGEMDTHLSDLKTDYSMIQRDLMVILKKEDVVKERLKQLETYYIVKNCQDACSEFLEIKEFLELSDEFEICNKIKMLATNSQLPIKEMNSSTSDVLGKFKQLREEKINSLKSFRQAKAMILWLKETMKDGLKELKVFVDLAFISAGEGDLEIDKVNCFHATTSAYAPLIFDLPPTSSFEEVWKKCELVWKELEADPQLPRKLIDTSNYLDWFKSVRQSHGSVEVTSLKQAEMIVGHGIYIICLPNETVKCKTQLETSDVMKLIVPKHEGMEELSSGQYTFSKVMDLQSRLMLVAGQAEKGNENIEQFTSVLDGVVRLARNFKKLCSEGCVFFNTLKVEFLSGLEKPVCTILTFGKETSIKGHRSKHDSMEKYVVQLANFLENCHDDWLKHLQNKRQEYVELSYYTVEQLMFLQQEVIKTGQASGKPKVSIYPLLSLMKKDCCEADLIHAMEIAQSQITKKDEQAPTILRDESKPTIINQESAQDFIQYLTGNGFSEKLAWEAYNEIPECDKEKGFEYCLLHDDDDDDDDDEEDEDDVEESSVDVDDSTISSFHGWNRDDETMEQNISGFVNKNSSKSKRLTCKSFMEQFRKIWHDFLIKVESSMKDYLSLEHLGRILQALAKSNPMKIKRNLAPGLKEGVPNLVVSPRDDMLNYLTYMYMHPADQILPQPDEVLLCTKDTTYDEVSIFLRRSFYDSTDKLHCLAFADDLEYAVAEKAEKKLLEYAEENQDKKYKLVVLCTQENELKTRLVGALEKYRQPPPTHCKPELIKNYLTEKLMCDDDRSASSVDMYRSSVRVVQSERAGVGKSLYVRRQVEELQKKTNNSGKKSCLKIPLFEKNVDLDDTVNHLMTTLRSPGETHPMIFHLDIYCEVLSGVDFFLYNLLVLGCVKNQHGHVWIKSPYDLYLVENICSRYSQTGKKIKSSLHQIFNILPRVNCWSPVDTKRILEGTEVEGYVRTDRLFDLIEYRSDVFQRPYKYLSKLNTDQVQTDDPEDIGTPLECITVLLRHCGIQDPTWAELHHFVWFLNTQLKDFEGSNFCGEVAAQDLPDFANFVLQFSIEMSRDFATRSLTMSEETPLLEDTNEDPPEIQQFQMKRRWELSPHPFIFFNPDHHSMTFLGFNIERETGNLIDEQTGEIIKTGLVSKNLFDSLTRNNVLLNENFSNLSRTKRIAKLCYVMGLDVIYDPDVTYELTPDNVKKILAIYMRFRCNIPVIVMGETGCGKTRLIKFMCDLQKPIGTDVQNMILMKVHGGTTSENVIEKVREAENHARNNCEQYGDNFYTVLFFDEANTTEAIGLIKEIMCDGTMKGDKLELNRNLKIVAACNPYRKHTEELIKRLENAGLGYHVDADATTDKLGRVPMRRLVYRVQPLPLSMLPLVWDFGQLNVYIEELYIKQMVHRKLEENDLPPIHGLESVISKILINCQEFMRSQKDECSFVSLRDVERTLTVMTWFYGLNDLIDEILNSTEDKDEENEDFDDEEDEDEDIDEDIDEKKISVSLILALSVCYRSGLRSRENFDEHIANYFQRPCLVPGGNDKFQQIIERCQEIFLEDIDLDTNIAKNNALKENVFLMVVCIELRLPLFLVGKPGSSKSLAKTIVADLMQGNSSRSDFFKKFKQAHMVSFQCSPLSTAEGIVSTFKQCAKIQKEKNLETFVSTVVLDEIGLAEDSSKMPLKTLHPLLEDGCEGNEKPESYKKVAFIGISNWALDPAKMNRGISVQREVPDDKELLETAEGICSSSESVHDKIKPLLTSLGESYLEIFEKARKKREFFGLRDFYSLVKMVYSFADKSKNTPCWHQLEHCIRRNFGGLDSIDAVKVFEEKMKGIRKDEPPHAGDPRCDAFGLIESGLSGVGTQSDSRYLLLLTENYEALGILQEHLLEKHGVHTIFGSSFPRDQEYTQVCRNINRIKVCMETGNTVILLNLENLYESLYDALNQYYAKFGGERYVDLGLGSHRVKCRVHKNFKLIVVAEKKVVYEKFPIPLINRLEKHFLTLENIMTKEQQVMSEKLKEWMAKMAKKPRQFSGIENRQNVCVEDVVMGYHADAAAAIVMKIWNSEMSEEEMFRECKKCVVWCCTPEAILSAENTQLSMEKDFLKQTYFEEQQHQDIFSYLTVDLPKYAQITTHSTLLTEDERRRFPHTVCLLNLQSFDTEQQFCKAIRDFTDSTTQRDITKLLIIQCDPKGGSTSLVKSAQYCVDEHLPKDQHNFHVIFIIQLDRISQQKFSGFQGGKWQCLHIDDLHPRIDIGPSMMEMQKFSIPDLIKRQTKKLDADISDDMPVSEEDISLTFESTSTAADISTVTKGFTDEFILEQLQTCIQAAVGRVRDDGCRLPRSTHRVSVLLSLLSDKKGEFSNGMINVISYLMEEKQKNRGSHQMGKKWLVQEACKIENINKTGTFRKAWCQYIEEKFTPLLAGLIAYIDKNLNLDIVNEACVWKKSVWLNIFSNPNVCGIKYKDMISTKKMEELQEFVVRNTGYGQQSFESSFPFSWLFYNLVETTLRNTLEQNPDILLVEDIVKQTVAVIQNEELITILKSNATTEVDKADVFACYIRDFVMMKYGCKDEKILNILCDVITKGIRQSGLDMNEMDLSQMFAAIHYAYILTQYRVQHFMDIISSFPEVLDAMQNMKKQSHPSLNEDNVTEDVVSLNILMEILIPTESAMKKDKKLWHDKVLRMLPIAERIMDYSENLSTDNQIRTLRPGLIYSESCKALLNQIRYAWNKMATLALFLEHFSPTENEKGLGDMTKKWQVLWKSFIEETDMRKLTSIKKIEKFLKTINNAFLKRLIGNQGDCVKCDVPFESAPIELPCSHKICHECWVVIKMDSSDECPKCHMEIPKNFKEKSSSSIEKKNLEELKKFHKRCDSFLMAVVSKLCFISSTAPEKEVIKKLMEYITVETIKTEGAQAQQIATQPMSVFKKEIDPTPICRLFLLKLLIRKSSSHATECLEEYFSKAEQLIQQSRKTSKEIECLVELCALVSYCQEDVCYETAASCSDSDMVQAIQNLESACYDVEMKEEEVPMMRNLQTIVQCRFGLVIAAKYLNMFFYENSLEMTKDLQRLIRIMKDLFKLELQFPKKFLIKLILKKYGRECYEAIMSNEDYKWIGFEIKKQPIPDRYVLHGTEYISLHQSLQMLELKPKISAVEKKLKNVQRHPEKMFIMAIHNLSQSLTDTTKNKIITFIENNKDFKLKEISKSILTCGSGDVNPFIGITAGTRSSFQRHNLESLLCHWFLVVNSSPKDTWLQPFYNLVTNLQQLQRSFIPTMPEENREKINEALQILRTQDSAKVYRCVNGHPYIIGNCGRPASTSRCNECNAPIGGQNHQATPGNTLDDQVDRSKTGHILGSADSRADMATPERSMSPAVCTIMRLFTHMSLMLGSKHDPPGANQIISPPIRSGSTEAFFVEHMQKDISILHKTLSKSIDDIYLLIHLLCIEIQNNVVARNVTNEAKNLSSKEGRKSVEDYFVAIMDPFIQNLDAKLAAGNKKITENSNAADDILLKLMCDVEKPEEEDMNLMKLESNPVMWRYRERITLEHFLRKYQNRASRNDGSFPLINLFMRERYYLQALQYLPKVIRFLYTLMHAFCRQIDRTEAFNLTLGTVFETVFEGKLNIYVQFDNFVECWESVKEKLISHLCILPDGSRLALPEEYHNIRIDKSSKLALLLPSTKGPGVCSFMLLEFLLRKHNDCLEEYYKCSHRKFSEAPVVEIKDIQIHDLVAFHEEKDILPLVLSNCDYFFHLGNGTEEITYDFVGFEKQLNDRIFSRKSRVKTEKFYLPIDTMLFKADSSNAIIFETLRNRIPQVSMNISTKHQISLELQTLPDICESLNNIDIANSFLKSLEGDCKESLQKFMSEVLMMKKTILSQTARNECLLEHSQCLWLLLSFEKDKLLAKSKKESFSDLNDDLKIQLEVDDKEKLKSEFKKLPIEKNQVLLHFIYDVILLRISHSKDSEDEINYREMKLRDILMGELDAPCYVEPPFEHKHLDLEMFMEWPETILGSHAIDVWRCLLNAYLKKEKEQL